MLTDIFDILRAIGSEIANFFTTFWQNNMVIVVIIGIVIVIEIVAHLIKKILKKRIMGNRIVSSTDNPEYYLEYYKKGQLIDIVRMAVFLIFIGFIFAFSTDTGANIFIIAAGALIVIFKEYILSVFAFFIILRTYKIGDTIGMGDIQGQIISIRIFNIGLLGKDNDGDNTGRHFTIPNYKIITENIRREELKAGSIRKEIIRLPYSHETYSIGFSDFLSGLRSELDTLLPMITKKNCGNFQTYLGHRYKIDIDYLEEKCIVISIGILGSWEKNVDRKTKIISWSEQYRVKKGQNQ